MKRLTATWFDEPLHHVHDSNKYCNVQLHHLVLQRLVCWADFAAFFSIVNSIRYMLERFEDELSSIAHSTCSL